MWTRPLGSLTPATGPSRMGRPGETMKCRRGNRKDQGPQTCPRVCSRPSYHIIKNGSSLLNLSAQRWISCYFPCQREECEFAHLKIICESLRME